MSGGVLLGRTFIDRWTWRFSTAEENSTLALTVNCSSIVQNRPKRNANILSALVPDGTNNRAAVEPVMRALAITAEM